MTQPTYLTLTEFAARLGIKESSLRALRLPEPDVILGTRKGWTFETIEAWNASRPGRGNWGTRPVDREDRVNREEHTGRVTD